MINFNRLLLGLFATNLDQDYFWMTLIGTFSLPWLDYFWLTSAKVFFINLCQGSFQLTLLGLFFVDLSEGYFRSTLAKAIFG